MVLFLCFIQGLSVKQKKAIFFLNFITLNKEVSRILFTIFLQIKLVWVLIYSFLASNNFHCSVDKLCKQYGPRSGLTVYKPFDTLDSVTVRIFKKVNFEKISRRHNRMQNDQLSNNFMSAGSSLIFTKIMKDITKFAFHCSHLNYSVSST